MAVKVLQKEYMHPITVTLTSTTINGVEVFTVTAYDQNRLTTHTGDFSTYEEAIVVFDNTCQGVSTFLGVERPLPAPPDFIKTINPAIMKGYRRK